MILFPAIDIYEGQAVRLLKGDYAQMTVYGKDPSEIAQRFTQAGASHIHIVDLEGAKNGETPNLSAILKIKKTVDAFCEVGGGIRSMEVIDRYLSAGIDRVILGTAAVKDPELLKNAVDTYKERIAVGVDILDGKVAIHGWTEASKLDAFEFCHTLEGLGIATVICTDISKDGAMLGTNRALYAKLVKELKLQIVASGGVSSIDDILALRKLELYGAIIGKAYYTGAIDLKQALEVAK